MADSEKYFTKTVDGQLSVATVAQSGEIIPEESRPGDKYTTALVQTDDGPQLCVKTFDLNGGGDGGGTVDQTYDPTSTNAQSGTAVAEAVAPYLKNNADGAHQNLAVGRNAKASSYFCVAVGYGSEASGQNCTAVGEGAYARGKDSTVIGMGANDQYKEGSTLLGRDTKSNGKYAVAIGYKVSATAEGAIQIGNASGSGLTNSTAKTFQVYEYQLLDGNTGKIPMARLPIVQCTQAEYDALVSGGTVDANTIYCIIPA